MLNISEVSTTLCKLIGKDSFSMGSRTRKIFKMLKEILLSADVVAHYHYNDETLLAADTSNFGLGAVILQVKEKY